MTITKRVFGAAILAALSSVPITLFADDENGQTEEQRRTIIVGGKNYAPIDNPAGAVQAQAVEHPDVWLGITLKEIEGDLATYLGRSEGILVAGIFPDSPAEAKLQVGDIIIAFEGQKLASPGELIEVLRKFEKAHAKKNDTPKKDKSNKEKESKKGDENKEATETPNAKANSAYPTVELNVMRRGQEISVELTPVARPESLKVPAADPQPAVDVEETQIDQLLNKLQSQGAAKVLRFGPPMTFPGQAMPGLQRREVRNFVVIMRDEEGNRAEVRIESEEGKPPKLTITEGDKSREISPEDIPQLDEKIRRVVTEAMERFEKDRRRQQAVGAEHSAKRQQIMAEIHKNHQRVAQLQHELRRLSADGDALIPPTLVEPTWLTPAEHFSGKVQQMAEELANRGVKNVQELAALPQELSEISKQVEMLKQELSEVQKQLRKDKN